VLQLIDIIGVPKRIRTPVTAVKEALRISKTVHRYPHNAVINWASHATSSIPLRGKGGQDRARCVLPHSAPHRAAMLVGTDVQLREIAANGNADAQRSWLNAVTAISRPACW
jgi:hypothetical protein